MEGESISPTWLETQKRIHIPRTYHYRRKCLETTLPRSAKSIWNPHESTAGFCAADVCLLCAPDRNSSRGGAGAIKADNGESDRCITQITKSPPNSVYVYFSHSNMATTPTYVADRNTLFPSHTFWGNREALYCTYAGLSLALLSYNAGRALWAIGRGGVGESLSARLIDSALRPRRGFLDTSALLREEVRKQPINYRITSSGRRRKLRRAEALRNLTDKTSKKITIDAQMVAPPYEVLRKLIATRGHGDLRYQPMHAFPRRY